MERGAPDDSGLHFWGSLFLLSPLGDQADGLTAAESDRVQPAQIIVAHQLAQGLNVQLPSFRIFFQAGGQDVAV